MKIIVCVKPAPDPKKWDRIELDPRTKALRREGIPSVLGPLDKRALEEGLRIREKEGGKVVVLAMAPPSARENLMEALAMGSDEAFLLSDRAFAGSDTWATARVLDDVGCRPLGRVEFPRLLEQAQKAELSQRHARGRLRRHRDNRVIQHLVVDEEQVWQQPENLGFLQLAAQRFFVVEDDRGGRGKFPRFQHVPIRHQQPGGDKKSRGVTLLSGRAVIDPDATDRARHQRGQLQEAHGTQIVVALENLGNEAALEG